MTKPSVFVAGLLTESCTFSPVPTILSDFERGPSARLLGALVYRIVTTMREVAEAAGWEVRLGLSAGAVPGGPVTSAARRSLLADLLGDLEQAMPVDAVCLALHGAMVAFDEEDCEGEILAEIRRRVGPDVPIGIEIDPHANLSQAMLDHADLMVCFKEWPHIDIMERAQDAMRLTLEMAERKIRPAMGVFDCRMIDLYHTLEEPMLSVNDRLREVEATGAALSASIIHGYPFCDVKDMGTKVLIITDNDPAAANAIAEEIGQRLIALRGRTRPTYLPLNDGMVAIESANRMPIVVADSADAPGGGAAGDATYLLRACLERGIDGVAVAYIHDPQAVDLAFRAGSGTRLAMRIGGKYGKASGTPLDLDAEIVGLFPAATAGRVPIQVGDVALVSAGGLEILISRERPVAMDDTHFSSFEIDPRQRRVLIVKSFNNFRAGFEAIAGTFVYVSGPGALDISLKSYDWKRIERPKWPIDATG